MIHVEQSSRPTTWDMSEAVPIIGPSFILFNPAEEKFYFDTLDNMVEKIGEDFKITSSDFLESESIKYLLPLDHQFSHTIHDSLTVILKLHEINPSAAFVLYEPNDPLEGVSGVHAYVKELLEHKNIDHIMLKVVNSTPTGDYPTIIKASNCIDVRRYIEANDLQLSLDDYKKTCEEIYSHIGETDELPYRKVYLSRSHIDRKDHNILIRVPGEIYDDSRMENEKLLEDFFREKGYEIVIPERDFKTFRLQLEYMRSVKVLASITSSGLLNSLFMYDNQYLLEIVAELVTDGGRHQTLVNHYSNYAYIKNHTHLAIQSRRDPEKVIERLKNLVDPFK